MENEYDQMHEIVSLIQEHMGWDLDKALVFMDTENPNLGGLSPMMMIQIGKGNKLLKWVKTSLQFNKE